MWLREYGPIQLDQSALIKAWIKTDTMEEKKGLEAS